MSLPPTALRRIMRELSELKKSPPGGIRIQTSEEDMLDVTGIIQGPEDTPYAGGYFKVKFKFTEEFPAAPPKCWFATKIFHPNVSNTGEICVNTLKKDWKSTYGIEHILVTVKCLLIYPNPESALDEEAGKLLLENYSSYCDRAKLITSVHATPRTRPIEFDTPAPEASSSGSTSTKSTAPAPSTQTPTPSTSSSSIFTLPIVTRKSASPAPPSKLLPSEKEGVASPNKERHASPSPLSTADANVGGKAGPTVGMGMAVAPTLTGSKAVKRAATGGAATGAEKRKKALKRL
ncbi:ubiquitin-conjugating enzyme/RWD-like protein [Lyophyllum atratum]|nr:ubiquitin-conjugating enzyme/RWD-like protein [Lyophyllum atratum]